jgi:hypothetical protein
LELDETTGLLYDTDREDLKVKVYRGLYVSEANDLDDAFLDDDVPTEVVIILDKINLKIVFFNFSNISFRKLMIPVLFASLNGTLPLALLSPAWCSSSLSSLPSCASCPREEDKRTCRRQARLSTPDRIPILPIPIVVKRLS